MKEQIKQNPLVGKIFHTYRDRDQKGGLKYQGKVIEHIHLDIFLVQIYDALMGSPTIQLLFSLEQMKEWTFYEDLEDLEYWWKVYMSKGISEAGLLKKFENGDFSG